MYPALSSSTALLGDGTPFSSFNIENPCDRSAEFFNATAGTIRFIRVIIRQEGSDSSLGNFSQNTYSLTRRFLRKILVIQNIRVGTSSMSIPVFLHYFSCF